MKMYIKFYYDYECYFFGPFILKMLCLLLNVFFFRIWSNWISFFKIPKIIDAFLLSKREKTDEKINNESSSSKDKKVFSNGEQKAAIKGRDTKLKEKTDEKIKNGSSSPKDKKDSSNGEQKAEPLWIVNVDKLDDPEEEDTMLERIHHKVMGIDTYFVEDDDYYKRKPSVGPNGFSLVHFDTRRSRRLITPGYVERLNKAFGFEVIRLTNNKIEEEKEKRRLKEEERANDPFGFKLKPPFSIDEENKTTVRLLLASMRLAGIKLDSIDSRNLFDLLVEGLAMSQEKNVMERLTPIDPDFVKRVNNAFGFDFIKIDKQGFLVVVEEDLTKKEGKKKLRKEKPRRRGKLKPHDPYVFTLDTKFVDSIKNVLWLINDVILKRGLDLQDRDRWDLLHLLGEGWAFKLKNIKNKDKLKPCPSPIDPDFVQRVNKAFGFEFIGIDEKGFLALAFTKDELERSKVEPPSPDVINPHDPYGFLSSSSEEKIEILLEGYKNLIDSPHIKLKLKESDRRELLNFLEEGLVNELQGKNKTKRPSPIDPKFVKRVNRAIGFERFGINKKGFLVSARFLYRKKKKKRKKGV